MVSQPVNRTFLWFVPVIADGRIGQARALENQCAVIHAVTVGEAPWCPAVDISAGAAGVYVPPDLDLPPSGILAQGPMSQPQWLVADIDLAAIALTRTQ